MLNLMKLEMKRMNFLSIGISAVSINLGIIGILLLLGIDPALTGESFNDADQIMMFIETLVVAAFVIHAASMLAGMIIEEFKNKTITVLFTTPVSRRQLLLAKVTVISLVTFLLVVLSVSLITYVFSILNTNFEILSFSFPISYLWENATHLLLTAIAAGGLSLIPLFFGMMKYSVPATITSSILIVAILSSSVNEGTNLFAFTAVPVALGVIGFGIAYMVINKAVKKDF
ncbi:ABC transporter permease [Terribacillus halophilus]|uniref:ABC transporter permease n=1 Tax=Terribacillus halophilus TaxID=361279 RepID=UPI000984790B|nr:ABC transporter permease [Terribacillus halophilus]